MLTIHKRDVNVPAGDNRLPESEDERPHESHHRDVSDGHVCAINLALRAQIFIARQTAKANSTVV